MARLLWISMAWLSMALAACSPAQAPAARRVDGSWHLRCGAGLESCVRHATDLCKDRGFLVLGGRSTKQIYGAELGTSQVAVREAELDVACADHHGELPTLSATNPPLALAHDAEAAAPAPAAERATSSARAASCTPGSTQRCFGAAACAGGQACLPDGSGYAACDCGAPTSKPNKTP